MIKIDGAAGEGGGQVLRTALGLSLVTGRSFLIENIRARRNKPGLMRQHLTAVRAAAEVGGARVKGAEIGSRQLEFTPGPIRPGSYKFLIGTAGSCTLVFQAILPALLAAGHPSKIVLEGGTHNPMAPPFDFLEQTFLPLLEKMGAEVTAILERPGFFPGGGGRILFTVNPTGTLQPLALTEFSNIRLSARAVSAGLPDHIGKRELTVVKDSLAVDDDRIEQVQLDRYGPGNIVSIFVHSEQLTETFTGFGRKRVPAERVAAEAVQETMDYLQSGAPVGKHLADQLLIPLALAGGGFFRTCRPSNHTLTNIDIISYFLDIKLAIAQQTDNIWEIKV